jgi:hypothetical protein
MKISTSSVKKESDKLESLNILLNIILDSPDDSMDNLSFAISVQNQVDETSLRLSHLEALAKRHGTRDASLEGIKIYSNLNFGSIRDEWEYSLPDRVIHAAVAISNEWRYYERSRLEMAVTGCREDIDEIFSDEADGMRELVKSGNAEESELELLGILTKCSY